MRDVIGGDASFDWTIWYLAARDLCHDGKLVGLHRQIMREGDREAEYDWTDASCDGKDYALALSRLGWCLRDAGYAAACEMRGRRAGYWKGQAAGFDMGYDAAYQSRIGR